MTKRLRVNPFIFGDVLVAVLLTGCVHLPINKQGVWTGPLPEPVTVKEAAYVGRPWYGRGVAPFAITLLSGSRTGLEWNEGRDLRFTEILNGIPVVGLIRMPYWCWESLSRKTMQDVANRKHMDRRRQRKYEAIIKRLEQDGRVTEAKDLRVHSPFDPANHPPDPMARIPPEKLKGFGGKTKILWFELAVGHRDALERNESRHLRKIEYWHPLILTRIWEAFEAGFGRRMEDIAEKEHLDRGWSPEKPQETALKQNK